MLECAGCYKQCNLQCLCGRVAYCDRKCQKRHWHIHRIECARRVQCCVTCCKTTCECSTIVLRDLSGSLLSTFEVAPTTTVRNLRLIVRRVLLVDVYTNIDILHGSVVLRNHRQHISDLLDGRVVELYVFTQITETESGEDRIPALVDSSESD